MQTLQAQKRRRRVGRAGAAALGLAIGLPQLAGSPASAVPVQNGATEYCKGNTASPDWGGWTRFSQSGAADVYVNVCWWGNQGHLQISRVIVANRNSNGNTDFVRVRNTKGGSTQGSLPTASIENQWYLTEFYPAEGFPSGYNSTTINVYDTINGGTEHTVATVNVKLS